MLFVTVQQLPAMMAGYTGSAQGVGSVYLRYLTAALAAVAAGWVVSRRAPYPYLGGLLIGGVLVSLLSILMYAQPSLMGALGDLIAPSDQVARPAGAMSDPNYFGMVAATMLVIAFGWLLVTRERVQRVLLLVVMVELGAGLAVSQSRSAFIALGLGLVVVAFTHSRRTGLVTTGLVATAGALLAPLLIQWRLTNTGGVVNALTLSRLAESDAGRLDLVLEGPRLFLQSPVFGVGLGGIRSSGRRRVSQLVLGHSGGAGHCGRHSCGVLWGRPPWSNPSPRRDCPRCRAWGPFNPVNRRVLPGADPRDFLVSAGRNCPDASARRRLANRTGGKSTRRTRRDRSRWLSHRSNGRLPTRHRRPRTSRGVGPRR